METFLLFITVFCVKTSKKKKKNNAQIFKTERLSHKSYCQVTFFRLWLFSWCGFLLKEMKHYAIAVLYLRKLKDEIENDGAETFRQQYMTNFPDSLYHRYIEMVSYYINEHSNLMTIAAWSKRSIIMVSKLINRCQVVTSIRRF